MGQLATSNWSATGLSQRGTALGIAATGISVSGVIMPAVSAYIIGEYGWRNGFITYGLITLLVVVPVVCDSHFRDRRTSGSAGRGGRNRKFAPCQGKAAYPKFKRSQLLVPHPHHRAVVLHTERHPDS